MDESSDWFSLGETLFPRVERAAWEGALAALREGRPVQVIGPLGLGRDVLTAELARSAGAACVRYCDTASGGAAWLGEHEVGVIVEGPSTFHSSEGNHRMAADAMFVEDPSVVAALEAISFRLAALPWWQGDTRDVWRAIDLKQH